MGFVEYVVTGDGPEYKIELRREAAAYERSIFNGTEDEWQREVVGSIGLLRRRYWPFDPIRPEVVAAFNAWRRAEHTRIHAEIRARGGAVPDDSPLATAPRDVRGAAYVNGTGWVETGAGQIAAGQTGGASVDTN